MSKFEKATKKVRGLQTFVKDFSIKTKRVGGHKYFVFYKKVTKDFNSCWIAQHCYGASLFNSVGAYKPGTIVTCRKWDTDRIHSCSIGLHIGTLYFAESFSFLDNPIIEVLVRPQDIICVPFQESGKIRCKRLRVARILKPGRDY
jgi:hypothetical protein